MKAIAEKASDYKYLLNVTASAAEVSQCLVDGIDNFLARVGARPLGENETIEDALVNRFGEDHAPEARANVVINSLLPLALNETGLLPACSPIPVDPAFPEAGKPYSFTAEVYVMPQLELEHYDAPKAVVHKIRISGADVDRQLYALAAEFAVTEKDPETGMVYCDQNLCVGCRTCVSMCPFGAVQVVEVNGITKAYKCDLCSDGTGEPGCPSCVG